MFFHYCLLEQQAVVCLHSSSLHRCVCCAGHLKGYWRTTAPFAILCVIFVCFGALQIQLFALEVTETFLFGSFADVSWGLCWQRGGRFSFHACVTCPCRTSTLTSAISSMLPPRACCDLVFWKESYFSAHTRLLFRS